MTKVLSVSSSRRAVRAACSLFVMITGLALSPPVQSAFEGYNGKIFFASTRDGDFEIYSMNADGSSAVNLTNHPASDLHPDVSADGTKVAFTTDRLGDYDVFVMNADGSGVAPVASGAGYQLYPSWSPDGTRLAYMGMIGSNFEIFVSDPDGITATNVSNHAATDFSPSWSPDGTKIAFTSTRSGGYEIHYVDLASMAVTQLTSMGNATDPDWSPDGTRVSFIAGGDVYHIGVDGTGLTNETSSSSWESYPSWSPDGTMLVYASNASGSDQLVAKALGGAEASLTSPPGVNTSPVWQPRFSNGDAAAEVLVNGPVSSRSGQKRFSVEVVNVGTDPVSFSGVSVNVELDGGPAPGSASLVSGSLPVTLQPGEKTRLSFEWSFPKGSVGKGSTATFTVLLTGLDGDVNGANNASSGSTGTV